MTAPTAILPEGAIAPGLCPGTSPKALTAFTLVQEKWTLRIVQVRLLHKTVQSTMPPRTSYELTAAGHALEPIIEAIAAWGDRYLPDSLAAGAGGDGDCPDAPTPLEC